ncbi:KTSC domain-containing protein [Lactiplantibacillus plantarum]|uniref:KTSC domain-containing protein n=1 Tax=Lactiplantibacillus plantarum TaxID=1590 RepID=UPI000DACB1E8|nr:KTSC domain-containing protein [Lactiplantibacillus plantarum]KAF1282665.1 KTSC domain-containing protein [Lactiplantibacillus plantarum]RAH94405.1 KTSC domain-containing protein [Lactiplantibacillus plantarum]
MNLIPVISRDLSEVGYNSNTQQLEIVFNSGGAYLYSGVTSDEYQGLMNASSKGRYFHAFIKHHPYVRVN